MDTETKAESCVYTRKQLVAYLGLHINTIERSNIPRICIGGRVLYRKTAVEKWLRERESINGKCKLKRKGSGKEKRVLVIPLDNC